MTPEELKASILQYAVQGKLVEQRPEEGTAEDLLKSIQGKKQQLIKEGKIKKEKPFSEITEDEIPFDIPESWKWVRLSDICQQISDGTHKTPTYTEKGVPFISVKDISSGYLDLSNTKFISEDEHQQLIGRCKPEKNDILICRIGTLGKALKISTDVEFSIFVSLGLIKLTEQYLADYIVTTINSGYGFSWIQKVKVGGGTHTFKINLEDLRDFPIPLPPLEEQHRIVAKIEEMLPFVDRYAASYEKLEQFNAKFPEDMKKSILQYAIQGKLVKQRPEEGTAEDLYKAIQEEKQKLIKDGKIKKEKPLAEITEDEIPFDIPENWKWVRISTVGITQTGNTPKKTHPEYFGTDIPFLGPGDIQNGIVDYENQGLSNEGKEYGRITPAKSILQVCIGGSIGKCALVDREVTFNQQINSIYPLIVNSEYIYHILDSYYFKKYMKDNAGGTATPIINRGLWDAIAIPLPPLKEQERIVAKINELLPYCDKLVK